MFKFILIFTCLFASLTNKLKGQAYEHLDINNIDARVYAQGDLFWDLISSPKYAYPNGGFRHTIFTASLWVGGFDAGGNLHLAANTYRQAGSDIWAGPLRTDDATISQQVSADWDRVWRVSIEDIEAHKAGIETTTDILEWPAHGDTNLGQAYYMAPFIDVSETGNYQPELGDYPHIKGDLFLWWVYNDNLHEHTESGANALGIEVHGSAYAFVSESHPDVFNLLNTLFFEYTIINRSKNNYHDLYVGKFVDFDIGYPHDDYIASIPEFNTYYGYNGNDYDPGVTGYGFNPPIQATTILNHDLSYFLAYSNAFNESGNPTSDSDFYHYLTGRWKNGKHLCYGGNGFDNCWDTVRKENFHYPDNPSLPRGHDEYWSEVSAGNPVGDRRGVGSVGPFDFKAGEKIKFDLAYITSPHRTSLLHALPQIQEFYDKKLVPMDTLAYTAGINKIQSVEGFNLYPNPAQNEFKIHSRFHKINEIVIVNTYGKEIKSVKNINHFQAEIETDLIQNGIYIVQVYTNEGIGTIKLQISR